MTLPGKIPGSRAKTWRFSQGYLKKSGQITNDEDGVQKAYSVAKLKSGVIGIQVRMMLPDTQLSDSIKIVDVMEVPKEIEAPKIKAKKKAKKKKTSKKKTVKKK